jgi:membrane protein
VPVFAYFRAPIRWTELARRTVVDTFADGCPGLAAQLAFYFLLALFPALLFVIALLFLLPIEPALDPLVARLDAVLPREALVVVRQQLDQLMQGANGGLLTFGIVGALWSSSSAMTAIITALNRAYDIDESRPWWHQRALAIALTVGMAVFAVAAFVLVVAGTDLAGWIAAKWGLGATFEYTWRVIQWPVVLLLIVFAVDLVYYFAPNADTRWVWLTPGSLLATGLWLVASTGFKVYVQSFSNFAAVYGAIGGVVVLMLWFYLSGFALLVGAELNAEIDRALQSWTGPARAPDGRKRIGPAAAD